MQVTWQAFVQCNQLANPSLVWTQLVTVGFGLLYASFEMDSTKVVLKLCNVDTNFGAKLA